MNWSIRTKDPTDVVKANVKVGRARGEDEELEPETSVVTAARSAANALAKHFDGDVLISVDGHETTTGRGFRPAHVTITVSRIDPKADVVVDEDAEDDDDA